jgi:hypothetical protein
LQLFAAALGRMRQVPGWAFAPLLDAHMMAPREVVVGQVELLAARLAAEEGEDPAALTPYQIAEKLAGGGLTAGMIRSIVDAFAEWRELEAARARLGWWGRLKRRVVGPPLVLAR